MHRIGRISATLFCLAPLWGCATGPPDTSRLEAAIERFERAAAQAEAAAAQAEASARHAEAAAQEQQYRRCAEAGHGPVRNAAQAARIAQAFLNCMAPPVGEAVAIARVAKSAEADAHYRVDDGKGLTVLVAVDSGRVDFPQHR